MRFIFVETKKNVMNYSVNELKAAHKLLKEFKYTIKPLFRGYTDQILYINVGTNEVKIKDVPPLMKEKFIGGKGYGLKLLWEATKPTTRWNDPENEIIIGSGPIGGITQYSGTGKSLGCNHFTTNRYCYR